jgi:hypothetical protein
VRSADRKPCVAEALRVAASQPLQVEPVGVALGGDERLWCVHLQHRDRDLARHHGFRIACGFL